jgi:hypothetical protein
MAEKDAQKAMNQAKKDLMEAKKAAAREEKRVRMEFPSRFDV